MPTLRLFNTATRRLETFEPLDASNVRMYCCGPTVYNFVHIGNLRTFLWGDLLRRYLQYKGYKVTQVMNFTDVDDRIIDQAGERGVSINEFTAPYVEAFFHDIDTLRIRRADIYPKATEHIEEMLDIVARLNERGHTYVSEGSTYFRIETFEDYGKLSQTEVQKTSAFNRIDSDNYDKENARDFVLWKARKGSEPFWPAAIGEGRPGWHLECSAMSMKYLGESFDIHTGAVDLIFPHHENELAQSEGATGKRFTKYWVHGEHLIMDDRKMSKSLGNVFKMRELLDGGHTPLQIRYALLAVPYRTKLNFSLRTLEDAGSALERIELFSLRLDEAAAASTSDERSEAVQASASRFLSAFEVAMDDDLNTAGALGALFTLIRETNSAIDQGQFTRGDEMTVREAMAKVDAVLDLTTDRSSSLDAAVEALIEKRNEARRTKNFAESDRLRDELLQQGIILEDIPGGTSRWRRSGN